MAKTNKVIGKERITREIIEREISSEYSEDYRNVLIPKKHKFNNGDFITIFQGVMREIAKAKLSKNELQMITYLIGSAGPYNSINIDLDTLCLELGDYKSNVCKTLNLLVHKNIIIKATKHGARMKGETNVYELSFNFDRLNYNLAYNGRVKEYKHIQHKDPKIDYKALPEGPTQRSLFEDLQENFDKP